MVYCQNSQSKTKAVTLVFKREELLYDAENYSFVEGDIMQAEDEHARHQVFDIGQDGNVDRVTRILNLVHSECVEMLFPYTKEEISDKQEPLDNVMTVPEEPHNPCFACGIFIVYREIAKTSDTRIYGLQGPCRLDEHNKSRQPSQLGR